MENEKEIIIKEFVEFYRSEVCRLKFARANRSEEWERQATFDNAETDLLKTFSEWQDIQKIKQENEIIPSASNK